MLPEYTKESRFASFLTKIVGSSPLDLKDRRRRLSMVFYLLIVIIATSAFSIYHFYDHHYHIFAWDIVAFFVSLVLLLYFRKNNKAEIVYWIGIFGLMLLFCITTIYGRSENSILFWSFLFPVMSFSIMGDKKGLFFALLFFCINVFLMTAPEQLMISKAYASSFVIRFSVIYIIITFVTYYYESSQETLLADIQQEEEVLKQSEEQYRLLAENITEHIWLRDLTTLKIIYLSPSVEKMYGYPMDQITNLPLKKLLTEESFQKSVDIFINEMPKALATSPPFIHKYSFETQARHKDGHLLWIDNTVSFMRDKNGNLTLLLGEVRDITERKKAEEKLQQTLESLKKAVGTTIQVLVSALESRDPYTAGHQSRVAEIACAIAREMGLPQDKIEGIRMAGIIHDIGKLSIPAEILSKPTKLTNLEFAMIKEHSQSGYEMLKDVESPWPLAQIVHQHHERMNGTGYPRNLKGDEIIIEARIMSVADVVEAMASHRPYRASLGIVVALDEIEKNRGILYDETVADSCLKLFRVKGYQFK